jgi:RND family efflux transporter MFP subunit
MKHLQNSLVLLGTAASVLIAATLLVSCSEADHAKSSDQVKLASHSDQKELLKVRTVKLVSQPLQREVRIAGELLPYREVALYPKVQGFVKTINVDRGTQVKRNALLVQIVAPEVDAHCGEAEGRVEAARSAVFEAESKIASLLANRDSAKAKLASDQALFRRVKHAAQTEGAVAPYDLEQAEQKVASHKADLESAERQIEGARSQLLSEKGRLKSAEQALKSALEMKAYLTIRAPFDGVITERNVHEGSLVNSNSGSAPMLKLQENARLRLVIPVPESAIAGLHLGSNVEFSVPAYTSKRFTASIKRIGHSLDRKTRSMTVEADVDNASGNLEPGMFPDVIWKMSVPFPTIFAPPAAIATADDGKTFVVRIDNGVAKVVEVTCKQSMHDLIEISGDVKESEQVALTSLHELKDGIRVEPELCTLAQVSATQQSKAHAKH